MPINTLTKRASAFNITSPVGRIDPLPSGAIDAVRRQWVAFLYAGIASGAPPVFRPSWAGNCTTYVGGVYPDTEPR